MNNKRIIIIEILVWLFIILSGLYIFIYNTAIKDNKANSYYLFVDDAGGLVKGSPVRLMGINIGYVRDVKIFDNKVFISFLVTEEDIAVPNKASATIEFYGLGGSTSLELSTKTSSSIDNREIIIPNGAYRIQDYWDGAKLSANVMIDIYGSIGRTIDSANLINHKDWLKQSAVVKDLTKYTNKSIEVQDVIIHKLAEDAKEYSLKKQKELDEQEINEAENE